MILELWLIQNGTMNGHILVADVFGLQMEHALRISPVNMMKFMFYLQEAIPFRIKGLHFINTTTVMDFILGMMKPFLQKELMDVVGLILCIHIRIWINRKLKQNVFLLKNYMKTYITYQLKHY
jgi:hypothetical protein